LIERTILFVVYGVWVVQFIGSKQRDYGSMPKMIIGLSAVIVLHQSRYGLFGRRSLTTSNGFLSSARVFVIAADKITNL